MDNIHCAGWVGWEARGADRYWDLASGCGTRGRDTLVRARPCGTSNNRGTRLGGGDGPGGAGNTRECQRANSRPPGATASPAPPPLCVKSKIETASARDESLHENAISIYSIATARRAVPSAATATCGAPRCGAVPVSRETGTVKKNRALCGRRKHSRTASACVSAHVVRGRSGKGGGLAGGWFVSHGDVERAP